jgi:hypothetical protein
MARSVIVCFAGVAIVGLSAVVTQLYSSAPAAAIADVPAQWAQYTADQPKTIVELQPFRTSVHATVSGKTAYDVVLTDLNPAIGSWYLLTVNVEANTTSATFHLQNVKLRAPIRLTANDDASISLVGSDGSSCRLALGADGELLRASQSKLPYASLCDSRVLLRNPVTGRGTSLERVTDFLRDHVWGGERIVNFVKKELYQDAFLERSSTAEGPSRPESGKAAAGPPAARVNPDVAGSSIVPQHVALDVDTGGHGLRPGRWYPVRESSGIFFSAIAPEHIDTAVLNSRAPSVNRLGDVETHALVYLVAFSLDELDLHFVLGTDHPRLDWSVRPPDSSFDPRLPGPDGIDASAPVVRTGMISPPDVERTVGAFVGGFKRIHGAFKWGELALRNHGSHYGFIEEGVIFSKLQPGLATVFVESDGSVRMKTWTAVDNAELAHLRYARQNGVPLIEFDERRDVGVPGALVNQWGAGNWSGSANEDLRTVRAGLCLSEHAGRRFLVYGYFSAATPSAMARVFQAYGCRYAMHLDMNALEHTYLALYVRHQNALEVEHLVSGMEEVDRAVRGQLAPRFLSFPDDRDFFYLTRKSPP